MSAALSGRGRLNWLADLEGFEPVSAAKQTSLCKAASPIFGNGFTGPETSLKLKPYLLGY